MFLAAVLQVELHMFCTVATSHTSPQGLLLPILSAVILEKTKKQKGVIENALRRSNHYRDPFQNLAISLARFFLYADFFLLHTTYPHTVLDDVGCHQAQSIHEAVQQS